MAEVVSMSQSFWDTEPVELQPEVERAQFFTPELESQEPDMQEPDMQEPEVQLSDFPEADQHGTEFHAVLEPEFEPPVTQTQLGRPEFASTAAAQVAQPVAEETEIVALRADEFTALEERIVRAVSLVKRERQARSEAEERAAQAEGRLAEHQPLADRLQSEVKALRDERDQVRQRVERLLAQLDALEV